MLVAGAGLGGDGDGGGDDDDNNADGGGVRGMARVITGPMIVMLTGLYGSYGDDTDANLCCICRFWVLRVRVCRRQNAKERKQKRERAGRLYIPPARVPDQLQGLCLIAMRRTPSCVF